MAVQVDKNSLAQHWVHSHEEDTGKQMVFRPAAFQFPPSRGRAGFDLKADGKLVNQGIAPTDGTTETIGTWKLEDDSTLAFYLGKVKTPSRSLKIISADKDRLVVKK